jgi:hypothetical protein
MISRFKTNDDDYGFLKEAKINPYEYIWFAIHSNIE